MCKFVMLVKVGLFQSSKTFLKKIFFNPQNASALGNRPFFGSERFLSNKGSDGS